MKKILVCFFALTILTLTACGKTEPPEIEQSAEEVTPAEAEEITTSENIEPAEPSEEVKETEETFAIEFAGLQLKYPKKWQDKITISIEEFQVCFSCKNVKLFDIGINSGKGLLIGTVHADEDVTITLTDYPIEKEDIELMSMQSDWDVILNHLVEEYSFDQGVASIEDDTLTYDIVTPIVSLKYPAKWKDEVSIEMTETAAYFSVKGTSIFDIVFTECNGTLIGRYGEYPVYIVSYTVPDCYWEMQEGLDIILENLMLEKNFILY